MLEQMNDQARLFNASNTYGIWIEASGVGSFMELSGRVQAALGTSDQPDLVVVYPELAAEWEFEKPVRLDWDSFTSTTRFGVWTRLLLLTFHPDCGSLFKPVKNSLACRLTALRWP